MLCAMKMVIPWWRTPDNGDAWGRRLALDFTLLVAVNSVFLKYFWVGSARSLGVCNHGPGPSTSVQSFNILFVQSFANAVQLEQGWANRYTGKRFSLKKLGENEQDYISVWYLLHSNEETYGFIPFHQQISKREQWIEWNKWMCVHKRIFRTKDSIKDCTLIFINEWNLDWRKIEALFPLHGRNILLLLFVNMQVNFHSKVAILLHTLEKGWNQWKVELWYKLSADYSLTDRKSSASCPLYWRQVSSFTLQ